MKYLPFLCSVLLSLSGETLFAETIWVQGVTAPNDSDWIQNAAVNSLGAIDKSSVQTQLTGQGWYDSNKIWPIGPMTGDSQLCWAATASNMLEWWQTRNNSVLTQLGIEKTFSGLTDLDPGSLNHYSTKIYKQAFFPNFTDGAGQVTTGLTWYLNGSFDRAQTSQNKGTLLGGFYSPLQEQIQHNVNATFTFNSLIDSYNCYQQDSYAANYAGVSQYLKAALDNAEGTAIGLRIANHAITCWGADFNDSGNLISLYITDSDDDLNCGLRKINVLTNNEHDTNIGDIAGDKYIHFDYIMEAYGSNYYAYLDEIYTLNSGNSTLMALANIPEPATTSLIAGFATFVLITSRRRKSLVSK